MRTAKNKPTSQKKTKNPHPQPLAHAWPAHTKKTQKQHQTKPKKALEAGVAPLDLAALARLASSPPISNVSRRPWPFRPCATARPRHRPECREQVALAGFLAGQSVSCVAQCCRGSRASSGHRRVARRASWALDAKRHTARYRLASRTRCAAQSLSTPRQSRCGIFRFVCGYRQPRVLVPSTVGLTGRPRFGVKVLRSRWLGSPVSARRRTARNT